METYLFYTTHLIMAVCATVVISARWLENWQVIVKGVADLASDFSFIKKAKESGFIKAMLVNVLSIGIEISIQVLR